MSVIKNLYIHIFITKKVFDGRSYALPCPLLAMPIHCAVSKQIPKAVVIIVSCNNAAMYLGLAYSSCSV